MNCCSLEDYLALPYTVEIYSDNDDEPTCFFARIAELPGSLVQADTAAAVEAKIEESKRAWIEAALAAGRPIPEPQPVARMATDAYPRRDELEFSRH
jgi:predicted RNase H-like HicB family nuclease